MKPFMYLSLIFSLIVGAMIFGWYQQNDKPREAVAAKIAVDLGGPFTLKNQDGQTVSSDDFKGKVQLVYFGYTFCPDFCPNELKDISDAMKLLGNRAAEVQPFFITIDPERDGQEDLKAYQKHFDPRIMMLYGQPDELKKVADKFKVFYAKVKEEGVAETDYLIDHTTFVYVMDKEGKFNTIIKHGTKPTDILRVIKEVL